MNASYVVRPATVDDIAYLAALRRAMFESMNVYTVPEWRDHGIASAIMQAILEYLHEIGVPVASLHATDAGRPIYERLGFAPPMRCER